MILHIELFNIFSIVWNNVTVSSFVEVSCSPYATTITKPDGTQSCYCKPCEVSNQYNMVCGSDELTYGNQCQMEYKACQTGKDIVVKQRKPCGMYYF